jgi:transcription factor SFP1
MMAGTSPSAYHPSSFQSSSYLPKMEASFFRDYWCCGTVHASLHDLIQHAEECHGQQSADILSRQSLSNQAGFSFPKQPSLPTVPAAKPQQASQSSSSQLTRGFQTTSGPAKSTLAPIQDDPLDSMDFDGFGTSMMSQMPQVSTTMSQQSFRQPMTANAATTQPFSLLGGNPTVSSVNTPTLSTQSLQGKMGAESSIPTSPHVNMGGFDPSIDLFGGGGGMTMQNGNIPFLGGDGFDYNLNMGMQPDIGGLTIHDPATQLSSKNGTMDSAQMQFGMNNGQFSLGGADLSAAMPQPPVSTGISGAMLGFPGHEEKKYKCPVIGCEKAYKNQNGLKYHKQVSCVRSKMWWC